MVELIEDRLKCLVDVEEVNQHARLGIGFALDPELDPKRMAMQPKTLVVFRHPGEPMRGFNCELAKNFHPFASLRQPFSAVLRIRKGIRLPSVLQTGTHLPARRFLSGVGIGVVDAEAWEIDCLRSDFSQRTGIHRSLRESFRLANLGIGNGRSLDSHLKGWIYQAP
jgi:hypothetical protein